MQEVISYLRKEKETAIFLAVILGVMVLAAVSSRLMPRFILFAAAIGVAGYLLLKCWKRHDLLLYVLVLYLPFSRQMSGASLTGISWFNILVAITLLAVLFWIGSGFKNDMTALHLPAGLFLVWSIFSILRGIPYGSQYLSESFTRLFFSWALPFLFYFLFLNTVRDRKTAQNVTYLIMIAITAVSFVSAVDYLLNGERVYGVVNHPNRLAAMINGSMFLLLGFMLVYGKKLHVWLLMIPFLICFRGLMVTLSRGGYLAFAAGINAVAFFKSKILFAVVVGALLLLYANPAFLPKGLRYRMGETINKQQLHKPVNQSTWQSKLDTSSSDRVEIWRGAIRMIKERPVLGTGYNLFRSKVAHYWSEAVPFDAHNTYLYLAAEMGIPALIFFVWLLVVIFWNAAVLYYKSSDRFSQALSLGYLGGFSAFLISHAYVSRLDYPEIMGYFWILAALIMRMRKIESKTAEAAA